MSDPLSKEATAFDIARAVMTGKAKAIDVVEAALSRIAAAGPTVNAFTDLLAELARKQAAEIDSGLHRDPLTGVPFAVKNLFDIEGPPTRAGSRINLDGPKARRDGALVRKLETAGAILLGGLNMGEYAYDFTGENAMQGWDPDDPACTDRRAEPALPDLLEGIDGLRITVTGDYFERGAEPEVLAAGASVAKALGALRACAGRRCTPSVGPSETRNRRLARTRRTLSPVG